MKRINTLIVGLSIMGFTCINGMETKQEARRVEDMAHASEKKQYGLIAEALEEDVHPPIFVHNEPYDKPWETEPVLCQQHHHLFPILLSNELKKTTTVPYWRYRPKTIWFNCWRSWIVVIKKDLIKHKILFYYILQPYSIGGRLLPNARAINDKTNKIKKMKNKTRAISSEIISTPEKPKNPATIAKIKNTMTISNIATPLKNYWYGKKVTKEFVACIELNNFHAIFS